LIGENSYTPYAQQVAFMLSNLLGNIVGVEKLIWSIAILLGCGCGVNGSTGGTAELKMWTTSIYGKRAENTNFYSMIDKDIASVIYKYRQADEELDDVDIVLNSLTLVRAQFGRSYLEGSIHNGNSRYQPKYLIVLASRNGRSIRVAAVMKFEDAFASDISDADISIYRNVIWNAGETSDSPCLRAYERFKKEP